jgi:tripartite-type tricarboxylate transporter receptor subunit TctC
VPAASVQELVALAKIKPGALTYGTGGTASASHLASAYFAYATGTEFLHVPYKGTAPFVADLLAHAARLNEEINKAVASADVKARLEKEGGAAVQARPEALGAHIAAEIERWRPVVKAANIRLE